MFLRMKFDGSPALYGPKLNFKVLGRKKIVNTMGFSLPKK